MQNCLIVDSNYLCYVMKYGLPSLSYDGEDTNIIYGFLGKILLLAEEFNTSKFVFVWDSKFSKRREIYPQYKQHRNKNKTEEEKYLDRLAYKQFDEIRKHILPMMGFKNVFCIDGYEGDDLIAHFVLKYFDNYRFVIISNDNDLYQLLDWMDMYDVRAKKLLTKEWFIHEHNIYSTRWIDVKCATGCISDNIKGIKGVGEKIAIKFLKKQLGQTTKAYQDIVSEKGQEIIRKNYQLMILPFDNKLKLELIKDNLYLNNFLGICQQYGFDSFLTKKNLDRWKRIFFPF